MLSYQKTFRASGERSRLHAACPNDFKNGRGRNQLSQPMGNGERTWSRGTTGNRSRKIVRRRLVDRAGGSKCDARYLLGLYRQRWSDPGFHQERRKSDWNPKDLRSDPQASARPEIFDREMNCRGCAKKQSRSPISRPFTAIPHSAFRLPHWRFPLPTFAPACRDKADESSA